ncbi:MAG: hypothetical protein ACI305_01925 [Lepagella sp.]
MKEDKKHDLYSDVMTSAGDPADDFERPGEPDEISTAASEDG